MTNSSQTSLADERRAARTEPHAGNGLDRRTFLGRLTLTAGAVVAGQLVSLSIARAAMLTGTGEPGHQGTQAPAVAPPEGDWHVDDICGHWPRYSHPIPFAPAQSATVVWEGVDPVDVALLS